MHLSDPALAKTLATLPNPAGTPVERCATLMRWTADNDLLALTVPRDHGGRGATLADAVQVTFDLARKSGSAGLTYAMHLGQLHTWAAHARTPYLTDQLRHLTASRKLVASVVSEPETGGNIHRATATLASTDLQKDTSNTSYVPDTGAFLVTAMDTSGPKPVQRLVLVRADATDAREIRVNRLMGMNGIDNRAWSFTFRYPPEAVFSEPFASIASTTMTAATHLLWAALWSGLAARALDTAARYAKAELTDPPLPRLSELRNRHYTLNALIRDNLPGNRPASPFAAAAQINRLKIVASETACDIALACLQIIGFRGYAEGGPYSLSEPLRDVLSGPLMVSNARLQANTASIDRFSEERP
jgi:acyl-CoA dehydrogenase